METIVINLVVRYENKAIRLAFKLNFWLKCTNELNHGLL